jgi:hypothetical protein
MSALGRDQEQPPAVGGLNAQLDFSRRSGCLGYEWPSTALPSAVAQALGMIQDASNAISGLAELSCAQDMARDTDGEDLLPAHIEGALHCAVRLLSDAIVTRLEALQATYPVLHQAQQGAQQTPSQPSAQPPQVKELVAPTIRHQASTVARKLVDRFGSVAATAQAMEMNRHTLGKVIHVDQRITEDTCRAVCLVARKLGVAVEEEAA